MSIMTQGALLAIPTELGWEGLGSLSLKQKPPTWSPPPVEDGGRDWVGEARIARGRRRSSRSTESEMKNG